MDVGQDDLFDLVPCRIMQNAQILRSNILRYRHGDLDGHCQFIGCLFCAFQLQVKLYCVFVNARHHSLFFRPADLEGHLIRVFRSIQRGAGQGDLILIYVDSFRNV